MRGYELKLVWHKQAWVPEKTDWNDVWHRDSEYGNFKYIGESKKGRMLQQ